MSGFIIPPLYIGPGIGVGTIVIVLLILALVLFSFGVIIWLPIKRARRKLNEARAERTQKRSLLAWAARIAVWVTLLCAYSWAVQHVVTGGRSLGMLTGPLKTFAQFPDQVAEVLESDALRNIPDSYLPLRPGFVPKNGLQHDLFGLNGFWNAKDDRWDVHVFNFRNDSVLHTWSIPRHPKGEEWLLDRAERLFENAPPMHSYLLPDRSLIAKLNKTPNLLKLDASSNILWTNHELIWHHSIQPSIDGNIWACGSEIPYLVGKPSVGRRVINLNGQKVPYQEDYLVKVDVNTGKILFKKGVSEILVENGMAGRLYGGSLQDPIHLNDASPLLTDGPYWKRGDLFVSVRGRSMVLLYRPSENKVVRVIDGPLILEHDVNVLDDHRISIFNNRAINSHQYPDQPEVHVPRSIHVPTDSLDHSQVLVFDFNDSSFTKQYDELLGSEHVGTLTQGIQEFLPNDELFIEAQNMGVYYVFGPQGVVMRKAYGTPVEGRVHGPNWTRIFQERPWPASSDDARFRGLMPYGVPTSTGVAGAHDHASVVVPVHPPAPMAAFMAVLLSTVLLAIGILLLQGIFIRLAERTAKLLDTLLDREPDEMVRQRSLIKSASGEMRALGVLMLALLLVLVVASIPLFVVGGFSMAGIGSIHILGGWNLLAMLIGGTLPFVAYAYIGKKEDYSPWSKLLHHMVLDNYNIGRYLFRLDRKKNAGPPGEVVPSPVVVTGLARSGTTALTTLLARSPAFHSLSYANMPFLLAPNIWRRFYKPQAGGVKERSHGDKVQFSYTSVEALEEYFFKVFLNDSYITEEGLLEHSIDAEVHHNYVDYQRMLRPKDRTASVYLAKNNNFILRYRSMRQHDPGIKVVLLFREPLDHAYSLMKQHARFSAMQEKDPFVLEYMNWLGHHEFGKGQKPFLLEGMERGSFGDRATIDHWLALWVAYYTRLLQLIENEPVLLVDYADLLQDPAALIARIGDFAGLRIDVGAIDLFENTNTYNGPVDEVLKARAKEIHARLIRLKSS